MDPVVVDVDGGERTGDGRPLLRAEEWGYLGEGKIHLVCHYEVSVGDVGCLGVCGWWSG